jgi:flagellar basal-body rod protein FlgB
MLDEVKTMWKNLIENNSSRAMEEAMDYSACRNRLLAQNVANVNTPNYKRLDVNFSTILDQTLATPQLPMTITNSRHIEGSLAAPLAPSIIKDNSREERFDGNNVDVEYEMAKVAENSMFYQALTSSWKSQMSRLKMVIEGRG